MTPFFLCGMQTVQAERLTIRRPCETILTAEPAACTQPCGRRHGFSETRAKELASQPDPATDTVSNAASKVTGLTVCQAKLQQQRDQQHFVEIYDPQRRSSVELGPVFVCPSLGMGRWIILAVQVFGAGCLPCRHGGGVRIVAYNNVPGGDMALAHSATENAEQVHAPRSTGATHICQEGGNGPVVTA